MKDTLKFESADPLEKAKQACGKYSTHCAETIRRSPFASVGLSVAVGVILRCLPIGTILSAILRLVLGLIKPSVILFGSYKLVMSLIKKSEVSGSKSLPDPLAEV